MPRPTKREPSAVFENPEAITDWLKILMICSMIPLIGGVFIPGAFALGVIETQKGNTERGIAGMVLPLLFVNAWTIIAFAWIAWKEFLAWQKILEPFKAFF